MHDGYYDEYGGKQPDSKVVAFAEQVASWKESSLMLYPQDVFNMLIDHSLIDKSELEKIMKRIKEKKPTAMLPTQHIVY